MKHETVPDVIQTLLTGRDRVTVGWCQRESYKDGSYCAEAAIYSDFTIDQYEAAYRYLVNALPAEWIDSGRTNIPDYNDYAFRTKADILALYDRAIALALKEGTPNA